MAMAIGQNVKRKESWDKVTGRAMYSDDLPVAGHLVARLLVSPHAHARIVRLNTAPAWQVKGVKAIVTGLDIPFLCGVLLEDRPPLAKDVVRYAGEPLAIVVAVEEAAAEMAVGLIEVEYELLPAVFSPQAALMPDAPLLHPQLGTYNRLVQDVYPQAGSNISSKYQVRKGDLQAGWQQSEVIIEQSYHLPPSDHLAMEVRHARASVSADGKVSLLTSSQAPFAVAKQLSQCFDVPAGDFQVHIPFVGGGFGGKAPVTLEFLAYAASRAVGGRPVRLVISREQDMVSAPSRIGMEAQIRLGASRDGFLQAAELTYLLDCGAYADIGPSMAKSVAASCSGPYNIENLICDALSVYTNHTYATSYRSFAHESFTFCIERAMDELAQKLRMDPLQLRLKNALQPGHFTPSRVISTRSNTGDLAACLAKLHDLAEWQGSEPVRISEDIVRATGIACLWKSADPPTNAVSGALLTFNTDGSVNLNVGVVEIGSASKTMLAQMLAEKLKMDVSQVHVNPEVQTHINPEHYKTVASLSAYMAGNAVMQAADDVLAQMRNMVSQALGCTPEDIVIEDSKVFSRHNPAHTIHFKDLVCGIKLPDGTSLGEPILAHGAFMFKGLTALDPQTGSGRIGPAWTVGASAVEVEFNRKEYTYRLLRATTVMDVGKVLNAELMRGSIQGAMAMGLSLASRESYFYNSEGRMSTPNLRTYKLLHIGQEPEYRVGFVETPQLDAPYGSRSISEHGIIAIPAALANALSIACGVELTTLPLTPETLWRACAGGA